VVTTLRRLCQPQPLLNGARLQLLEVVLRPDVLEPGPVFLRLAQHARQNSGHVFVSSNTLGIWSETWSLYSQSETTRYTSWEYECHDCGLFTLMRSARTH
jgi:hypothetical protein